MGSVPHARISSRAWPREPSLSEPSAGQRCEGAAVDSTDPIRFREVPRYRETPEAREESLANGLAATTAADSDPPCPNLGRPGT